MILARGVEQAPRALIAAGCKAFGGITTLLKNDDLMNRARRTKGHP